MGRENSKDYQARMAGMTVNKSTKIISGQEESKSVEEA